MEISEGVIRLGLTASTDNALLDLHNSSLRYSASFINC